MSLQQQSSTLSYIHLIVFLLFLLPALSLGFFFRLPLAPTPPPPPPAAIGSATRPTRAHGTSSSRAIVRAPQTTQPKMCITGLAAPFVWRRKLQQEHQQRLAKQARLLDGPLTTSPPRPNLRASDRRPFSLSRAALLGPFAFEVYKDPAREAGEWASDGKGNELAVLDPEFVSQWFGGRVKVRVLSVKEGGGGKLGRQGEGGWLPNLLGFSDGGGKTAVSLAVSVGEEASACVPFTLHPQGLPSSYVAKPLNNNNQQGGGGGNGDVTLAACVRRASLDASRRNATTTPNTSAGAKIVSPEGLRMNVTLAAEDRRPLGSASLDLTELLTALPPPGEEEEERSIAALFRSRQKRRRSGLLGVGGGEQAVTSRQRKVVVLKGGEGTGDLAMELELSFEPFLPLSGSPVRESADAWHGATGCSRDWRSLATAVGGDALSAKDMKMLAFVENRDTDAQVKVWRDEKRRRLVVAFRGTDPTRLGDIVTDLKLLQEPWDVSQLDRVSASPADAGQEKEEAWLSDLYASLAWQANVTGLVFNSLTTSLSNATSAWDAMRRAFGGQPQTLSTPLPPTSPPPQKASTVVESIKPPTPISTSPLLPTDSSLFPLLEPLHQHVHHTPSRYEPFPAHLPDAYTAPILSPPSPRKTPVLSPPSPSPPPRPRRRDMFWSRRSSRPSSSPSSPSPSQRPKTSEPSAVDQAVADVFTSVLDKVLGALDPAVTDFHSPSSSSSGLSRLRSTLDFQRVFRQVVSRAAEHLGSQVLSTWDEMEARRAESVSPSVTSPSADSPNSPKTTAPAAADVSPQPLDLLVLIGQAGSSPLVMLPTRFRQVFDSLVAETLRAMEMSPFSSSASTEGREEGMKIGEGKRRSKRSRIMSIVRPGQQEVESLKTAIAESAIATAAESKGEEEEDEHPSQSDFKLLLSRALDLVLTSLQEKQVGAFTSTLPDSLLKLNAEAFGVSPLPRVHSGFREAYLSVRPQLLDLIQAATNGRVEEEGWEILCTGHSMGGSLAMLLAHDLSEKFSHNRVSMYSFGQPRTGNSAFSRAYNRANGDSYRIVNEYDVIARFPRAINSSVFNYEHAGRTVLPNYMPPANTTTTAADSTSIWVEGEQPGLCPLRDLEPLAPADKKEGGLPANLSPVFLAAEWNLLNSFVTGAALSNHLEYRYLESLESTHTRREKTRREAAKGRKVDRAHMAQVTQTLQDAVAAQARVAQLQQERGNTPWVPRAAAV